MWSKLAPTRPGGSFLSFSFSSWIEKGSVKTSLPELLSHLPKRHLMSHASSLTFLEKFFVGRSDLSLAFPFLIHQPRGFGPWRMKGNMLKEGKSVTYFHLPTPWTIRQQGIVGIAFLLDNTEQKSKQHGCDYSLVAITTFPHNYSCFKPCFKMHLEPHSNTDIVWSQCYMVFTFLPIFAQSPPFVVSLYRIPEHKLFAAGSCLMRHINNNIFTEP